MIPPLRKRVPLLLSLVMLAALCVRLLLAYDRLPSTVASHFDAAGAPNGYQGMGAFLGLAIIIGLAMLLLFAALPRVLMRIPEARINLPHRAHWLAPERKAATITRLTELLDWFGCATIALLAATIELVLRANLSTPVQLQSHAMWIATGAYLSFALMWTLALLRTFRLRS